MIGPVQTLYENWNIEVPTSFLLNFLCTDGGAFTDRGQEPAVSVLLASGRCHAT